MIKLLVVDNEDLIRKALLSRLKKRHYQFEKIFEASSGEEALQIIQAQKPDLVITDVKMYDVSGLDLLHICKEFDFCPKFIIISGYAEFDFVQDSINNGACGYLLKPITNEKLFEIMDQVLASFPPEKLSTGNSPSNPDQNVKLNYLISRFLLHSLSKEEYHEFVSLIGGTPESNYVIGSVYLNRYSLDRFQSFDDAYQDLNLFLQTTSSFSAIMASGKTQFNRYIIFHSKTSSNLEEDIYQICKPYFHKMMVFDSPFTMGLSSSTKYISSETFSEADMILSQRFFEGNGLIFYSHNLPESPKTQEELQQDFKKLEEELKFKSPLDIQNRLVTYLHDSRYLTGRLDYLVYNIYILLIRLGFSPDEKRWRHILEQKSWIFCENKQAIIDYLETEIFLSISPKRITEKNHTATYTDCAKDYIHNHYTENLTLHSLAEQFHLNPRYFSTIFRKAEGKGPIEYLTEIRISHAQQLLKTTTLTAAEIASSVGFDDSRYFYRVFKKVTGSTPTVWRQHHTEKEFPDPSN